MPRIDLDETNMYGGHILEEGKTLQEYYEHLRDDQIDKAQNVKKRSFFEGNILEEEIKQTLVHRMICQELMAQVVEHNVRTTGERWAPAFAIADFPATVGALRERTPDVSICHEPSLVSLPAVAIEVFHTHGGIQQIRNVADFYLNADKTFGEGVSTFIAVKVMHPCPTKHFSACAFVFKRKYGDMPVAVLSFGDKMIGPQAHRHIAAVMDVSLDDRRFHGFRHDDQCEHATRKQFLIPLDHLNMSLSLFDLKQAVVNAMNLMTPDRGGRLDVDNLWEEV